MLGSFDANDIQGEDQDVMTTMTEHRPPPFFLALVVDSIVVHLLDGVHQNLLVVVVFDAAAAEVCRQSR